MAGASSSHPYYPLEANIVDYAPNRASVLELLFSFGGGCTALLAFTLAITYYARPNLLTSEKIAILWFVLCMTPGTPCRRGRNA